MGVEKISFANVNHNKDRLIILISVKVDFKPKKIIRDKEYFKNIIKNNKAYMSLHLKQSFHIHEAKIERIKRISKFTGITEDSNILLSIIDKRI